MKNRTDRILLAVFLLSLALYAALLWETGTGALYPYPTWFHALGPYLLLGFLAVPFFSLQLLLCRGVRRRWPAFLPPALVIAAALVCALGFFTATGWDALGWLMLLLGCIAPAAGCALAWMAYGVQALRKGGKPGG